MAIQLPPIRIDYLKALTDNTGIFQHAKYCIPKRNEGYTTDDNARALIACINIYRLRMDPEVKDLASVYLAFLYHMQKPDGIFHNYLGYERIFLDVEGSEDCIGRALWSCGCAINSTLPSDMRMVAKEIFDKGLPWVWKSTSLRFYAHTLLGLTEYFHGFPDKNLLENAAKLADRMIQHYQDELNQDWHWFEPYLTYDNARLSQALFHAYKMLGIKKYLDVALESLKFLVSTQIVDGTFMPIGNDGWYKRSEDRAFYDQQPLEAAAMVEAAVEAYYATMDKRYADMARLTFGWFLGKNSLKMMVYNTETDGCFDGLSHDSVNVNQGAESSISYLLARLKMEELTIMLARHDRNSSEQSHDKPGK